MNAKKGNLPAKDPIETNTHLYGLDECTRKPVRIRNIKAVS